MSDNELRPTARVVWDLPVRMTHWLLLMAVTGSYVTSKYGMRTFRCHKYCGYGVLVLVIFRIIWGFVGTRHARFTSFLRGPKRAIQYLRTHRATLIAVPGVGHNPLGGWSVTLMLLMLFLQAGTGLFANDDIAKVGPLFGWVSKSLSDVASEYHRIIFISLKALISMHVLAIGYYCWIRKHDLLTPMVTGRKPAAWVPQAEEIRESKDLLALAILVALVSGFVALLYLAPPASLSVF